MNSPDRVVVDTNVLSYLFRRSLMGAYYRRQLVGKVNCVACTTPEELYFGAEKRNWGDRKRQALDAFITDYVLLPVTFDIARISGHIRAERARAGRPLDKADAWIAATALGHGLPLFTHDRDFQGIEGLRVVTLPEVDLEVRGADSAADATVKGAPFVFASFGSSVLQ